MGRRAIVLLVALILAGLAAWAVWQYLQNVESEITEGQALTDVFRAGAAGISEGSDGSTLLSDIGEDDQNSIVEGTQDQIEDLPVDAIDTREQLNAVLAGRVAAGPISANTILTESQWTEVTIDVTPLAEEIPSGKQAMTISLDNVRGVNGFVEPGDRVNMIITLDISFDLLPEDFSGITVEDPNAPQPDPTEEPAQEQVITVTYTRYVLQGLPVMATGRDIRPDEDAPETVDVAGDPTATEGAEGTVPPEETGNATIFTLEVTPEQAERIAYSFESGSIWLTLAPVDFVEVETNGVIIDNLFGDDLLDDIFGTSG